MPKFKYEVQGNNNQVNSGTITAESVMEASSLIRQQGGYLLNISEVKQGQDIITQIRNYRIEGGPGLKDIMGFTKQLAVMIKAGISIRDAVEGIAEQQENQAFKKCLMNIKGDVESGTAFSAALAKHRKVFSPLYVNMVKASEMSGTFAHMLERLSAFLGQQAETRSQVRGAMIYPAVLFTMSIGAVVFLLTWVLPRFMVVFEGKEHLLPAPTKMLIAMSDFMVQQWYILVGGAAACIVGFIYGIKTPAGKQFFDKFVLKVPLFRKMLRAVYITRSLQTLGELLNAGVPMLETLQITADISGNTLYKNMWLETRDAVKEGSKLVHPLSKADLLPKSVIQMIASGEESGRLGDVLQDVSEFYARELRDTIKACTGLLEPIMIVFMGVVVGFIAMSIILPVFKMSSIMKAE